MSRARLGALALVSVVVVFAPGSPVLAQEAPAERVLVFLVPGVSFDELLGHRDVARLATSGGAALMRLQGGLPTTDEPGPHAEDPRVRYRWIDPRGRALDEVVTEIVEVVGSAAAGRLMVVVASTTPSPAMLAAKDEMHPVVMASGDPVGLLPEQVAPRSLTSDSTRRSGVVSDLDVGPTIAGFLGIERSDESAGAAMRPVDEAAPFDLHERYLGQRRIYVPVGVAAALYVVGVGLLALAITLRPAVVRAEWRRVVGWATLSVAMLAVGLLAAGHLPELTYASAVPLVAIVSVFGTLAFSPLDRRDPTLVVAGIGLAVIAFLVAEAALGWSAMLTPLLGASELDGARFFGMPNIVIGLLVGACLWVAQRLSTAQGVGLLCAAGLFAGLPFIGSDLGGAVTAFATAGMWLAIRHRERLGVVRGLAAVVVLTVAGTAVVLVAHAISPFETHVTRFERTASGLGSVLETIGDRLRIGLDLVTSHPASLVPVAGLPILLLVALRPPPAIRSTFERRPAWRDAVVVTALAGMVAVLANDTGPAAGGLAFGLGLGGMLGVSLLAGAGKMETS